MMGIQEAPARLFYDFDLEAHVPADHLLRQIDHFLDVRAVREALKPHYSHLGRPSIDPELIVRMLVIGYTLGIRSERRLCDEVHLNLAYRDVLPHFRNIEAYDGPPSQYRGAHGPISVRDLRNENAACDAWLKAASDYGLPHNPDFNAENAAGIGRYQLTLDGHWRSSAGRSMLKPALSRPNLTLELRAHVTGLIQQGTLLNRVPTGTIEVDGAQMQIGRVEVRPGSPPLIRVRLSAAQHPDVRQIDALKAIITERVGEPIVLEADFILRR